MKKLVILSFVLVIILGLGACKKDNPTTPVSTAKKFVLYLNYYNPDGRSPEVEFDSILTSPEIKIDFSKRFEANIIPPNKVDVLIDNMRIVDANNQNYIVKDIKAYEKVNSDWFLDLEFTVDYQQIQDMIVMLALDVSASLGSDFTNVKKYAVDFINRIKTSVPTAKIGVADFSSDVNLFPPTDNQANITAYINGLQQGQFTSLFDAVGLSITTLQGLNAQSKSLLIFSDGNDNDSDPNLTPVLLATRMTTDPKSVKIASFSIGLKGKGDLDENVLKTLSVNGGTSAFPKNSTELEKVFQDFSKTIASAYTLTYHRNQQIITQGNKRVIKFEIEADIK